jgi:trimethylamine--corrinoid protein Co-methyltransferase
MTLDLAGGARVLTDGEVNEIHQASLEVLERTGVVFKGDEALKVFGEHGAEVDGNRVRLSPQLVERMVKQAPKEVVLHAKDPEWDVHLGQGKIHCTNAFGATWVYDLDTGEPRKATLEDLGRFVRLADRMENVHYVLTQVVPQDVPGELLDIYSPYTVMKNTRKNAHISLETAAFLDEVMEMGRITSRETDDGDVPTYSLGGCPNTPLVFEEAVLLRLMRAAEDNVPFFLVSGGFAGGSTPVTLAGTLVVQNAELLAGIALSQLVNPGAPLIYGTFSCAMDMATGKSVLGGPELSLMNAASQQLCDFYGLPFGYGTGGIPDSPVADLQAGMEKTSTTLFAALAGVEVIHDGASGLLGSGMITSYEQMVMDNEMCNMVGRLLQGIEVNPDTLAVDLIHQVGPGGNFLATDHTYEHFRREHYLPKVLNREPTTAMFEGGVKDMAQRAKEKARELLAEEGSSPLSKEKEEAMERILKGSTSR